MDKFKESYEALDLTTREMRTGRGQRVNKDLDNRKEIVEIKSDMAKVRSEVEETVKK